MLLVDQFNHALIVYIPCPILEWNNLHIASWVPCLLLTSQVSLYNITLRRYGLCGNSWTSQQDLIVMEKEKFFHVVLLYFYCITVGTNGITLKPEFVISSLSRPFHIPMASACGIMIQVWSLAYKLETYFLDSGVWPCLVVILKWCLLIEVIIYCTNTIIFHKFSLIFWMYVYYWVDKVIGKMPLPTMPYIKRNRGE